MLKDAIYIFTCALLLQGCSDSGPGEIEEPPIGEDPIEVTASDEPPTDLWIINMNAAGKGEKAGIMGCSSLPVSGEANIRDSLNLGNDTFFGVFGANYNTDGSFINAFDAYPSPLSNTDDRNKVSVTFIFDESEQANAELTIKRALKHSTGGIISCSNGSHKIDDLVISIREIQQGSGVLSNLGEVKFTDESLTEFERVDRVYVNLGDDFTVTVPELFEKLRAINQTYRIRIVETIIVENNEREIIIPPSQ
jgi:hypothetical protein